MLAEEVHIFVIVRLSIPETAQESRFFRRQRQIKCPRLPAQLADLPDLLRIGLHAVNPGVCQVPAYDRKSRKILLLQLVPEIIHRAAHYFGTRVQFFRLCFKFLHALRFVRTRIVHRRHHRHPDRERPAFRRLQARAISALVIHREYPAARGSLPPEQPRHVRRHGKFITAQMQKLNTAGRENFGQHQAVARNVGHFGRFRVQAAVRVREFLSVAQTLQILFLSAEIRMGREGECVPGNLAVLNEVLQFLFPAPAVFKNGFQRPRRQCPDIVKISPVFCRPAGCKHAVEHVRRVPVHHISRPIRKADVKVRLKNQNNLSDHRPPPT